MFSVVHFSLITCICVYFFTLFDLFSVNADARQAASAPDYSSELTLIIRFDNNV